MQESKNCGDHLIKFSILFEWTGCAVETCWLDESHFHLSYLSHAQGCNFIFGDFGTKFEQ